MDFAFTPEQEKFRREVQSFFAENRVQRVLRKIEQSSPRDEKHPDDIYRWLGERGWLAVNWPEKYGGLGKSLIEAAIVTEEMGLSGVPDTAHGLTIDIVGQFLLMAGTEEQKQRYLPSMARGEMQFAVLYTEPEAGSDLASLRTYAEFDGSVYKIYGTKIYNLKAHNSQYALCAARTRQGKTKYDGITIFIVPLDGPGVEIRPLWNLTDERFNKVIFNGLSITPDHIVGPLHSGWSLLNRALSIERTGLDFNVKIRRWFNLLFQRAVETDKLQDPMISQKIADIQAQLTAGRLLAWRMTDLLSRGIFDETASAMSKWYNSELGRQIARLGLELEGCDGILSRWDHQAPLGGWVDSICREVPGLTLAAGTSEIMLYLISTGLKLYE